MNAFKDWDVYKRRRLRGILYLFGLIRVCVVYSERQVVLEILQCTQWLWLGFFFKPVKPAHSDGMNTSRRLQLQLLATWWQQKQSSWVRARFPKMSQVNGARQEVLVPSHTDLPLCIAPATENSHTYSLTLRMQITSPQSQKAAPIYNFITINEAIKKNLIYC